jgi:hypothetical protein
LKPRLSRGFFLISPNLAQQEAPNLRLVMMTRQPHTFPQLPRMSRTEPIIQFIKIVIGLAFGAYFLWWSLEVLNRLPPQ